SRPITADSRHALGSQGTLQAAFLGCVTCVNCANTRGRHILASGAMAEPLDDAVLDILSGLILFKNRADAQGWRDAFENMPVYLERVGLAEDLRKLKVIHVAGTKGKVGGRGSTCALVEGVLRRCGYRTGLFTSPHLVDVRERIRIAGQMVSKQVFEEQFWDCHRRLAAAATPEVGVPGYFRFLTLLALRVFVAERVDVVVLEVGIGGRLDATNIIPHPLVCGVTSLGFDHMEMLGDTLPKIAREKAGIFKPGRPAFTVWQPPDALEALQEVAQRVGTPLQLAPDLDSWRHAAPAEGHSQGTPLGPVAVGLGGEHQRLNAGLAVQLCLAAEQQQLAAGEAARGAAERVALLQQGRLPAAYAQGLAETEWPGRSQVLHDPELLPPLSSDPGLGGARPEAAAAAPHSPACGAVSRLSLFIDGAHTPESMPAQTHHRPALASRNPPSPCHAGAHPPTPDPAMEVERVLLFNCMKERDPGVLLPALAQRLQARGLTLHHALFVPPNSQYGFLATKRQPYPILPSAASPPKGAQPATADITAAEPPSPPSPHADKTPPRSGAALMPAADHKRKRLSEPAMIHAAPYGLDQGGPGSSLHASLGKPKLPEKATARLNVHRVMAKKKRKGSSKHKKVVKVPGGAVLRGCEKTKRKLMVHFQLRAEVHSQFRIIASLCVLRIFLTCLVGYPTSNHACAPTPPAVQPPKPLVHPPYPHSPRVPLPSPPPAQPASMECDRDSDFESDWSWSQQRDQPVKGLMWCPVVASRKPPQAPRSSKEATPAAASEPGPSNSPPAKRSKRTKAEQAVEPTQPTKGKGKAAKAQPAPQLGRWLDRDCNAALNMQRIGRLLATGPRGQRISTSCRGEVLQCVLAV
ncbi:hypothetical protein QJQ45_020044, partial [Haematococcus lacustris]